MMATRSLTLMPIYTLCWIVSFCGIAVRCQAQELDEIEKLSALSGEEYRLERDRLLASRSEPIVFSAGTKLAWRANLTIMIANARIANMVKFKEWEDQPLFLKRSLRMIHPLLLENCEDESEQLFLIEQVWKGVWADQMRKETSVFLMRQALKGNRDVWQQVLDESDREDLRAMALNALCHDGLDREKLLGVLKKPQTSDIEIESIFRRMVAHKSEIAGGVIMESIDRWKESPILACHAMSALAAQTDKPSRNFLYKLIMDESMSDVNRASAIVAMGGNPHPSDIAHLNSLLGNAKTNDLLQNAMGTILSAYRVDETKHIIHRILKESSNEALLYGALVALERKGQKGDEALLDIFDHRKDVPEGALLYAAEIRKILHGDKKRYPWQK